MSCHRFANEKRDGDFCFGHIKEVLNETAKGYGEIVLDRMEEVKAKKYPEKCRNCVAEVGCEKGCYHANWMCKGNLTEPPDFYCRIRQESAKQVTYADIRLKHIDPLWFTKGNPRVEAKLYLAKIKGGNNNGNNNNQTRRFYVQGYLTEVRGNDNFQRGNTNQNRQGTGTFRRTQGNTNPGGSTGEMRFCQ
jgi:radical SAM protein with 4Fe4S-binding SPASM domain